MAQRSAAQKDHAIDEFTRDVYTMTDRLSKRLDDSHIPKLNLVRHQLIEMYKKDLVKINHSVLELICAAELISQGCSVEVEKPISDILVCDVYAKNAGVSIIEIETGFTPPENALDSVSYYTARIASKISRYSKFCSKFSLATPILGLLPVPRLFCKMPFERTLSEVKAIKNLCDLYYKNPAIDADDIYNATLDSVYLLHVDGAFAKEVSPSMYAGMTSEVYTPSHLDV